MFFSYQDIPCLLVSLVERAPWIRTGEKGVLRSLVPGPFHCESGTKASVPIASSQAHSAVSLDLTLVCQ